MDLVFVYGTLRRGEAANALLAARAAYVGDAWMRGRLGRADGFPAAVHDPDAPTEVAGEVHRLTDATALAELDAYEGDAYARRRVPVRLADGTAVEAWAWTVPNLP